MYYRGSLGGLLIFDLTNYESFEHLPQWIDEVRANIKNEIPLLLVGNKSDLIEERKVTIEEINDFTRNFNLYYMETSAKTGEGVGDCFHILACLMVGVGVPAEFVAQGIAFNPGEITLEIGAPSVSSKPVEVAESTLDFEAPPVPEPVMIKEPAPELEFEAPPIPEPAKIKEPEPELQFEAPPIPEPEPEISFEPEPELEFEAPPVPEPEIDFATPEPLPAPAPKIPAPKASPDFEFKMPDEILSSLPKGKEKEEEVSSFTPLPSAPGSADSGYKPKAVPFSSNIPVPAPGPAEFTAPVEPESKTAAPFIVSKRPETPKPKPASLTFEAPTPKSEPASASSSIFPVSTPTSENSSQSLVDYMPETILSKKERKKLEKQKKKEAKLKAKADKERKIQEAKEKYQKELEEKKKAKKSKKEEEEEIVAEPEEKKKVKKSKKEEEEEIIAEPEEKKKEKKPKKKKEEKEIPEPTAPMPTPASAPSSLFQTLSTKTEDGPLSQGTSFIPFSSKEKATTGTSKLRIIPNVDDITTSEPKPMSAVPRIPVAEKITSTEKKKEIIICKQCGAILSNDYAFCNKCGAKL